MGIPRKILTVVSFLFFTIALLLFDSCTIGGSYFFVNESDKTITLVQHFKDMKKYISYYGQQDGHTVLEKIKDPKLTIYGITNSNRKFNRRTHKYLDPVPVNIDSVNQIVEIIIPPKKAIQFDGLRNYQYIFSKKIQIKIDKEIYELEDLKLKYKSRGFGLVTSVIKYQG